MMRNINQRIKDLQNEVFYWSELLSPVLDSLVNVPLDKLGRHVLEDDDPESPSINFVFEAFAASYGRLKDIEHAARGMWPENSDVMQNASDHECVKVVADFINAARQKDEDAYGFWANTLVGMRIEGLEEAVTDGDLLPVEDLLTLAHRWRRALAKARALGSPVLVATERLRGMDNISNKLLNCLSKFPTEDQLFFKKKLKRYLANEYLYPWLYSDQNSFEHEYLGLFRLADIKEGKMRSDIEVKINEMVEEGTLNKEHVSTILRILYRLADALQQLENYADLIDQVVYGGGQWGENSMVGHHSPVNVIPSNGEPGSCKEVLLAFAQGKGRTRTGLKTVMRKVREHLILCEVTRIAIIFTDTWDPQVFSESKGDFDAHRKGPHHKSIIGVLVNGNRMTIQAI